MIIIQEVVFEVIIAIVILGLLVGVIGLFRGNMDIIGTTAEQVNEMDKVKESDLAVLPKTTAISVNGSEVIAAIRYFAKDGNVKIFVNGYEYSGESKVYDSTKPQIGLEDTYTGSSSYDDSTKITTYTYVKNP